MGEIIEIDVIPEKPVPSEASPDPAYKDLCEGRRVEGKKRYTYKDYARLPEGAPYQLIGGELIMVPAPLPYHQEVSKRLEYLLYAYVELKHKFVLFQGLAEI